ncbi:hypothetical protein [Tamlana flava]|uniref:hypothetical protein n=1 Tax=Tamlana flava TaxID=3158572 RepID=UPI00351B104C
MKNYIAKNLLRFVLSLMGFIILNSCGQKTIDEHILGTWHSKKHRITVRIKPDKFKFYSDSTFTTLTINEDKTVSGHIGLSEIKSGKIGANWLLSPETTGVAYTIKCKLHGKIFENDPLETKDVQFWIGPDFSESDWELRYTTNGAQFPMAFIFFDKKESDTD